MIFTKRPACAKRPRRLISVCKAACVRVGSISVLFFLT
jgi:hypothetical protein